MNELALFAGAGGGILGGHLLGWRTVCAVEWEAYPASVLVARQNDKILPPFPIWDDVQTFDGKPWRGIVDVVSGGFPCQDISVAGNGDGLDGERSGMWREMARIVGEIMPQYVFVENSPMLTTRGLGTVLRDLAKLGYDAEWGVLGADDVGANHHRKRIWLLAYTNSNSNFRSKSSSDGIQNQAKRKSRSSNSTARQFGRTSDVFRSNSMQRYETSDILGNSQSTGFTSCELGQRKIESWRTSSRASQWWASEPNVDRVANGLAARVDRLKAIGNGQVPLCAATAWNILKGRIDD
jgi:DNA (cytosine-5)-methyltransferase 1